MKVITGKKIVSLMLGSAIAVGALTGCGAKKEESVLDKVTKAGVIHVGTANNNPPYELP